MFDFTVAHALSNYFVACALGANSKDVALDHRSPSQVVPYASARHPEETMVLGGPTRSQEVLGGPRNLHWSLQINMNSKGSR